MQGACVAFFALKPNYLLPKERLKLYCNVNVCMRRIFANAIVLFFLFSFNSHEILTLFTEQAYVLSCASFRGMVKCQVC